MPTMPKPVVWHNETNYTGVVTDPLRRFSPPRGDDANPPGNPQVYWRIVAIYNEIFIRLKGDQKYYWLMSSESVSKVPAYRSSRTPVDFSMDPDRENHPTLTVTYHPESSTIPIRFDFLEDHPRMNTLQKELGNNKFDEFITSKFKHPIGWYYRLTCLRVILGYMISGNFPLQTTHHIYKELKRIMETNNFDMTVWTDEYILSILQTGVKTIWNHNRTELIEILKLAECLREEFYKRRFRSALQY